MNAKKWILKTEFSGMPKLSDFKIVQEQILDSLDDREILCKAEWLSVDPYMRGVQNGHISLLPGDLMPGSQVARVLKSRHPDFPEGTLVVAYFGWRDLTIFKPDLIKRPSWFYKLPDMQGLPDSYALGAVGLTGNTAYFGVDRVLEIKEGGTIVVSTAAGAVGGLVCQLAKMRGCTVVAFAGSFEKTVWLKRIGARLIFDYNIVDVDKTLSEYVPDGVDYFFDNVGGEFSHKVLKHMKENGRIAVCGAMSTYNKMDKPSANEEVPTPFDYMTFIYKKLRMEGFLAMTWEQDWHETLNKMIDWIMTGKIQVEETITDGFENMPQAFIDLFLGKNVGKQIVKA